MASAGKEVSILVVDDASDTRELLKRNLTSRGYRTSTAQGVVEAVKILDSSPVDLVITDQTMPHITGAELARELLRIRPDIPIILCTGYSELITPEKVKALGVRELLMKPVSMSVLSGTILKVLEKADK